MSIGYQSGYTGQGDLAVAIGHQSGQFSQGINAVAIGYQAGYTGQGQYAIAIGYQAGYTGQPANSIILNASGNAFNGANASAFYVNPVRNDNTPTTSLVYNTNTFEITYNTKTFVIDHPTSPDKYLVHACLEGPEAGVYYSGEGIIDLYSVSREIVLPNYVKHIANNFTIQITSVNSNNSFYTSRVNEENGTFKVFGKPGEFFWHVYGTRQTIEVEPLKKYVNIKGSGPYKWI